MDESALPGVNRHLCAVCQMEFAEDVADVTFDRILADK
jgi:hypothetical protein